MTAYLEDSLERSSEAEYRNLAGPTLIVDPKALAVSRVGVIDVGSNSVRMVVFDGAARSPAYFFNEKLMCGLGAGVSKTGQLNPEGKERARVAIRRFVGVAKSMQVNPLVAVATAAVREAEDGKSFCDQIEEETGLKIWIIDGQEEARLSAQGVLLGWPTAEGLVCDIGGSSMEMAVVSDGQVGARATSQLGPLKLADVKGGKKGLRSHIKTEIEALYDAVGGGHEKLFLVGGSWRAFARLDMLRQNYPLAVLHEYEMTPKAVRETIEWIEGQDIQDLRTQTGISNARITLVPQAIRVLSSLLRKFKPKYIAVSSYGIREGLLFEQMVDELRRRDPLIEASRHTEARMARMPGFGQKLYDFIFPIFENGTAAQQRLALTACLLHDVSWRANPDYRHEVCFDTATQANLGGLNHTERLQLGLALLHRYKNNRDGSRYIHLFDLISEAERNWAEALGKAMRFGAMFSGSDLSTSGKLVWNKKRRVLSAVLSTSQRDLFGEVAEARLQSLARSMNATHRVKFVDTPIEA